MKASDYQEKAAKAAAIVDAYQVALRVEFLQALLEIGHGMAMDNLEYACEEMQGYMPS